MKITLGELRNLISESLKDQDTNEPDPLWDFYKYTFKVRTELSNPYNLEIINTFRDISNRFKFNSAVIIRTPGI